PAREGPALLQGLILCGRCGQRMTVRYHVRQGRLCPDYVCQRDGIEHAQPVCQHVPGTGIDEAIGALLVEAVSPVALEVTLTVQQELESRVEEIDRLRLEQVARAQYEADLARRRYMRVDPLCVLRSYVICGCEMLCWRSSSTVPGTHNYSDFRKAMRP